MTHTEAERDVCIQKPTQWWTSLMRLCSRTAVYPCSKGLYSHIPTCNLAKIILKVRSPVYSSSFITNRNMISISTDREEQRSAPRIINWSWQSESRSCTFSYWISLPVTPYRISSSYWSHLSHSWLYKKIISISPVFTAVQSQGTLCFSHVLTIPPFINSPTAFKTYYFSTHYSSLCTFCPFLVSSFLMFFFSLLLVLND